MSWLDDAVTGVSSLFGGGDGGSSGSSGGGIVDWFGSLFGGGSGSGASAVGPPSIIGSVPGFYPAGAMDAAGSGSGLFSGIDWGTAGQLGLMGLGIGGQMFGGGGQQQMPANLMSQTSGMGPEQIAGINRRTMSNLQSQGLSGASPDFLASQMGLTPEELDQMMRRGGGGGGA